MWRPDSWSNPYRKKQRPNNSYATIFEAGANQLLRELNKLCTLYGRAWVKIEKNKDGDIVVYID